MAVTTPKTVTPTVTRNALLALPDENMWYMYFHALLQEPHFSSDGDMRKADGLRLRSVQMKHNLSFL